LSLVLNTNLQSLTKIQQTSGLSGRTAVLEVLKGLVDNPAFVIQDPKDTDLAYPVKEEHLRDPRYWHSNDFSLRLLENAANVIGGYRPLFQAGITAGYRGFVVNISDSGSGIMEENLNEIFEPFYSTKPTTGTGLGLGVAKRLIRLYDG